MATTRTPLRRLAWICLVFIVSMLRHAPADAQTAFGATVVTGPGGLCLDVLGTWSEASPPPVGTAIVLSPCDGSDDQRFELCYGDCNGEITAVNSSPVSIAGGAVVTRPRGVSTARLESGVVHVLSDLPSNAGLFPMCLTSAMPPVAGAALTVAPCDGRPGQAFHGS